MFAIRREDSSIHGAFVPVLLALGPALWVAAPLFEKTPLSSDHAVHLFKAWHFWNEMLGKGRLHGWSHFWGFGYPDGELIPFGSDAWVALFRAATLGQLPWTRTYALAFAGFLLLKAGSTYALTRRFFGVATAVVSAWIATWDPGAMLQGGWVWHTYWGVWPVTLAMSFASLSLARLKDVLDCGRTRDVFWSGAWFGAALLTHPLALFAFPVAVPLLLLDHLTFPTAMDPRRSVTRVAAALLFGVALGASYIVPLLSRGAETKDLGWLGDPLTEVSRRLLELRTFDNVWAPVEGLAIIGAWIVLWRRRSGSLFFVFSAAVFVFLSSDTLIKDLDLARAFPTLVKMEFNRNLLVAKLFWFPLAAHAAVTLARVPSRWWRWPSPQIRTAGMALGLALAALLLAPGWPGLYAAQFKKPIQGERETPHWDDLQAFLAWSKDLPENGKEHYRIAYYLYRNNHLSIVAPVFNHTLFYKANGIIPHQLFNKMPMHDNDEIFQALSIKYVMSSDELGRPNLAFERKFGSLWAYRYQAYRPEPFTVEGPGHAELEEFESERIRIKLSGTAPDSRIKVHVASYPRWEATIAGQMVPISTVTVNGAENPVLMEMPARDGELVLRYVYRLPDGLGLAMSLGALPGFAFFAWAGRRSSKFRASLRGVERWVSSHAWLALVILLGALGIIAGRTLDQHRLLPPASIFHRASEAGLTLDGDACHTKRLLSFTCGSHPLGADVVSGMWGVHTCMTAPDAGELRLRTRLVLGSFLAGSYDPTPDRDGAIRLAIDGREVGSVATRPAYLWQQRIQFDTRAFKDREATIDLVVTGAALHCFDFQIVE